MGMKCLRKQNDRDILSYFYSINVRKSNLNLQCVSPVIYRFLCKQYHVIASSVLYGDLEPYNHLGFWSGNLFLIAPFPDLCLLVPF